MHTSGPGGTIQQLESEQYDAVGLLKTVTSAVDGESWDYDYDDGYRLTTATNLTQPSESQSFTYDAIDRITTSSRYGTYSYPPAGDARPHAPMAVNGVPISYDANGNMLAAGTRSLAWNADNLVSQVTLGTLTTSFVYDGLGERVKKTSQAGKSLYPFGDDYEVTNGVVTKYIAVDGLGVIAKRVTGGPSPGTYWLHSDRLGSIQTVTDTSGAAVFRRAYRPYGETLAEAGAHTESRGWIDQRNDHETGLTYLHARYFDPQLGVFISPDPIGIAGGVNVFAYGLGNPINSIDRSGLKPVQVCVAWATTGSSSNSSVTATLTAECAVYGWTNVPDPVVRPGEIDRGRGNGRDECQTRGTNCKEPPPPTCKPDDPNCGTTACQPGDPGCKPPTNAEPTKVNWYVEFGKGVFHAAFIEGVFFDGGCGAVFVDELRDHVNPFTPSPTMVAEPLALMWGASRYNDALAYAASRANYRGGTGLIYPMKSSVFRAGLLGARTAAASGVVMNLTGGIVLAVRTEYKAAMAGECR